MLYKRVAQAAEKLAGDKATLGKHLGIEARTFQGYFSDQREHKLWPLLPKILEFYPRLSRQWLYFGEGPMRYPRGETPDASMPLRALVGVVEEIAADAGGGYRELLEYMIGMPRQENADVENIARLQEENARLERQVKSLTTDLCAAQKKIIALLEDRTETLPGRLGKSPVPGANSAAHSPRDGNE